MTVLLETRNVSKVFDAFRALDRVNLAIHDGELVSVVGPNGAGKTTLIRVLLDLTHADAGTMSLLGYPVPH